MNPVVERTLLDRSCAKALVSWITAFREINPWSHKTAYHTNKELPKNLANSVMPNYNDFYVPPAYIVRYQLGHIYMAKVALDHLDRFRQRHQNALNIIDFGSGASACRIASALMMADSIERGQALKSIEVIEIDSSVFMHLMGRIVWQEFIKIVESEFANSPLAQAVQVISCQQVNRWDSDLMPERYTWLTSFHALYPFLYDMGAEVAKIHGDVDPAMGVFTCYAKFAPELVRAFPFAHKCLWSDGNFPKSTSMPDGRVFCPSDFIAQQAKNFGFWKSTLRPYLQTKKCALLWGSGNPSITRTPVSITIP